MVLRSQSCTGFNQKNTLNFTSVVHRWILMIFGSKAFYVYSVEG